MLAVLVFGWLAFGEHVVDTLASLGSQEALTEWNSR